MAKRTQAEQKNVKLTTSPSSHMNGSSAGSVLMYLVMWARRRADAAAEDVSGQATAGYASHNPLDARPTDGNMEK